MRRAGLGMHDEADPVDDGPAARGELRLKQLD
jgi:hypothetical protein